MKKTAIFTFLGAILVSSASYAQAVNNATVNQISGFGGNSSYVSQAGFLLNNAQVGQASGIGNNYSGVSQNTSFFGVRPSIASINWRRLAGVRMTVAAFWKMATMERSATLVPSPKSQIMTGM